MIVQRRLLHHLQSQLSPIQEEKYLRDRPMEASKRAAPGDTLKELSAILQALGDESPRGGPAVAAPDVESHPEETETAPPPPPEDGRGRGGRSCASRRAAPGDTLREELMVMRLGADADGPALDHTRGR